MKKKIAILGLLFCFLGTFLFITWRWLQPPLGRTNFLFLGIGGKGHTGEDLTDSIIFVSVDHQGSKTLILSLPRDIWLPEWRTKLNSIYHYKGLEETKRTVGKITGQNVNYGVIIDFEIFKKIIDFLGGVEVEVERSFDDYKYPIPGKENDLCGGDPQFKCRYEHLHFDAGFQLMDGEGALKYIRSRYAEGEEGTDFARSRRQQRLLLAIKNKILSPKFFLSPGKPLQLIKLLLANVKTDIPQERYLDFFKIALKFHSKNLRLEILNNNYLINPPSSKEKYDNQWVLVPKSGDWGEIQEYIKKLLES